MAIHEPITTLQHIPFYDDELLAIVDERTGTSYVLPKPMSDMFGLSWQVQLRKLKRNQIFNKGITLMVIPTSGGPQEAVLLERRLVHAWLFSIDVKRVALVYQEKLLRYQHECADVLDRHFTAPLLPPVPMLPEPKTQLALIEQAHALLTKLGQLTKRDTLMFADQTRNVMTVGSRLLPVSAGTMVQALHGFSVAERVGVLGYHLSRSQQAALYPQLGKRIIAEWRQRYGKEPSKEMRWVDGAQRQVAWYAQEDAAWIDPIIQGYLSQFPGLPHGHVAEE